MSKQHKQRSQSKHNKKHNQQLQQTEKPQDNPPQLDKKTLLSLSPQQQLTHIRDYYNQIIVQPETHFKHLDLIFILTKSAHLRVAVMALRVLAEIFISTAPLQPVDMKQLQDRTAVQVTREQYNLLKFEQLLVNQYERYLNTLIELHSALTPAHFQDDHQLFQEFRKCLLECVIKCYRSLWNFNHFKVLNELMFKFIKHEECREVLSSFLSDKNIATLNAKTKILHSIGTLLKEKPEKTLPDDLIQLVNRTHIDTAYLIKDTEALKFKKKKLTKRLYKQQQHERKKQRQAKAERGTLQRKNQIKQQKTKQKMRVREQVNREFAQGEPSLNSKQLVRNNSALLQQIFYIYFKLLTQQTHSKYLRDCLQGVLLFAHLINIDLTANLLTHLDLSSHRLRQLWKQNRNQHLLQHRLLLVFTCESLLNGPLSVYNMDDLKVTAHLFRIMRDINQHRPTLNHEHFRLLAITLDQVLLKRRQLSQEIVASLLRELSLLLLQPTLPKLYLLELIRQTASKYNRVHRMFEEDNEGYGLNSYNAHCEDPQSTNAIHTQIITNLQQLTKSPLKQTLPESVPQIVQRLRRLNFNKAQNCPTLEQLLEADLTLIEYKTI